MLPSLIPDQAELQTYSSASATQWHCMGVWWLLQWSQGHSSGCSGRNVRRSKDKEDQTTKSKSTKDKRMRNWMTQPFFCQLLLNPHPGHRAHLLCITADAQNSATSVSPSYLLLSKLLRFGRNRVFLGKTHRTVVQTYLKYIQVKDSFIHLIVSSKTECLCDFLLFSKFTSHNEGVAVSVALECWWGFYGCDLLLNDHMKTCHHVCWKQHTCMSESSKCQT